MNRAVFPSDLTQEQFAHVRQQLEESRRKTRPRKYDLHDVFCAILHLLHSGCAWRSLPPGFPPWRTVHEYFLQWTRPRHTEPSLLEQALARTGRVQELARLRELLALRVSA